MSVAMPPSPTAAAPTPRMLADAMRSISGLRDRAEILDALAPLVTRLGFDRAIVSEVVAGAWTPFAVFVPRDRRWAQDIREAGRNSPQQLGIGTVEDEMLPGRRPVIVRRVQGNPRVHQGIALVSRSREYLAAPVTVGARVGAIVHVDRFWTRAALGADDAAVLQAVADAAGMALERASLCHGLAGSSHVGGAGVRSALTERELEVATMISEGMTNPQIAAELVVAEATVKTHVKHILRKLGAGHRAEVVSMLLRSTP